MERDWLMAQLAIGKSFEQIGRETGRDGSTIAWHAKRLGLRSLGSERFRSRGQPDRKRLEELAAEGATLAEIAVAVDRSIATVRYWLDRWSIPRNRRAGRTPADPSSAPKTTVMTCRRHGQTTFRLQGDGRYRCLRCRTERVSEWRRRVKRELVAEAGGMCAACGYDLCPAALQFHHLDPSAKEFALSNNGVAWNITRVRAEAAKCVLLCANCHAEVEAGYRFVRERARPAAEP